MFWRFGAEGFEGLGLRHRYLREPRFVKGVEGLGCSFVLGFQGGIGCMPQLATTTTQNKKARLLIA